MSMDNQELEQLLGEVGRFARERVAELAARPESPIGPEVLSSLTMEAVELGILPVSTTEDGCGIWEHRDDTNAVAFNTGALRRIAYASPGIAFAWHRMGLARFVANQLGLSLGPGNSREFCWRPPVITGWLDRRWPDGWQEPNFGMMTGPF